MDSYKRPIAKRKKLEVTVTETRSPSPKKRATKAPITPAPPKDKLRESTVSSQPTKCSAEKSVTSATQDSAEEEYKIVLYLCFLFALSEWSYKRERKRQSDRCDVSVSDRTHPAVCATCSLYLMFSL